MMPWRYMVPLCLMTLAVAAEARETASLLDVDVLPSAATLWVASLHLSNAGFEIAEGELGGTRYFLDITPATWLGGPVARSSQGGVTAWRWAEFSEAPPTVRMVVEHRSGWSCGAQKRGQAVEVSCRPHEAVSGPDACSQVAVVRGIGLCSPIDELSAPGILARSLDYLPHDVVRDGLPHFGAVRDDWKGQPRPHQGLDIYVNERKVLAMAAGTVAGAGRGDRAGGWVKIDHGSGVETVYVHLRTVAVKRGDAVQQGQLIGTISGPQGNAIEPQLHLEIRLDGTPVDPAPLFMAASPPDLQSAWQRAIAAVPARVEQRQKKLSTAPAENKNRD
jgi:hypothetical protein